jgi:hypothetical protein
VRAYDHIVLHAEGIGGGIASMFEGQGSYFAVTGGIDVNSCAHLESVCAYVGGSAGYAASKYIENDWFGDTMQTGGTGAVGMLRAGLDVGNKHVRWRPGLEVALFGPNVGALTQSVEFRF